jgi:hypothetical protein
VRFRLWFQRGGERIFNLDTGVGDIVETAIKVFLEAVSDTIAWGGSAVTALANG